MNSVRFIEYSQYTWDEFAGDMNVSNTENIAVI